MLMLMVLCLRLCRYLLLIYGEEDIREHVISNISMYGYGMDTERLRSLNEDIRGDSPLKFSSGERRKHADEGKLVRSLPILVDS